MPGSIGTITGDTFAKSGQTVMGRIYGHAGTAITQVSLSAVAYTVTRVASDKSESVTGQGSLTISDVVFDTLQDDDPRWEIDDTGYNFAALIPASCFQEGGQFHRIAIKFTPATGEVFYQLWTTRPTEVD